MLALATIIFVTPPATRILGVKGPSFLPFAVVAVVLVVLLPSCTAFAAPAVWKALATQTAGFVPWKRPRPPRICVLRFRGRL